MHNNFKMKDLGLLKYFLGIEIAKSDKGLILNQRKYILDLIATTGISACKPKEYANEPRFKALQCC